MHELDLVRQQIIDLIPPYEDPGPRFASTVYVWPTAICRVGCAHCNFASPISSRDPNKNVVGSNPEKVLSFLADLGCPKMVLSGGGEPMEEMEFVLAYIERVSTSAIEEIEIITSGMFATDEEECRNVVRKMVQAYRRRSDVDSVSFTLRLSVDLFHAKRIGIEPIVHILNVLNEPEFSDVSVYIRSVLIKNDTTMTDLANALGGSLTEILDFQQQLKLANGRLVTVYYKNLIIDGRLTHRRLDKMGIAPDDSATSELFGRRFLDARGKHVPARMYNGPTAVELDGLALIIENDGAVKILEGNSPDRAPSLFESSWDECLDYLYADPLTIFLIEEGPISLADLLADFKPDAPAIASDTNQLYYIADKILATPYDRLMATLKVLEYHMITGRIEMSESCVNALRAIADRYGTVSLDAEPQGEPVVLSTRE